MITYFAVFHDRQRPSLRISAAQRDTIAQRLERIDALRTAFVYTPESARDPYLDDGAPPQLALQLYFEDIAALEACLGPHGPVQALRAEPAVAGLHGAEVQQQAMLARSFPVPAPRAAAHGDIACTYLVSYPGPARDLNAWLTHYIGEHPALMAGFPGIRRIEVCTRIDYCSAVAWARAECMLRNSTVFDSAPALTEALHSPVRHAMREDFGRFPPYEGGNTHYPMETLTVLPRAGR